jgi:hypothetical protein
MREQAVCCFRQKGNYLSVQEFKPVLTLLWVLPQIHFHSIGPRRFKQSELAQAPKSTLGPGTDYPAEFFLDFP